MAAVTLSSVKRGISGRFKTWQGEYTHSTGADQDIATGLTFVHSFRLQNTNKADVAITVGTVSGGTITIAAAGLTDESEMVVYAEGW